VKRAAAARGQALKAGYKVVRYGPGSFAVEGFPGSGNTQRFRSASGFRTEAEARQWVYDQQIKDAELDAKHADGEVPYIPETPPGELLR
jgi:hypothetical protein